MRSFGHTKTFLSVSLISSLLTCSYFSHSFFFFSSPVVFLVVTCEQSDSRLTPHRDSQHTLALPAQSIFLFPWDQGELDRPVVLYLPEHVACFSKPELGHLECIPRCILTITCERPSTIHERVKKTSNPQSFWRKDRGVFA